MSERVLVVDDEADLRELVCRLLGASGYEVEEASDGSEALARIAARPPDLVVLDLMMPAVDGWVVLDELQARPGPRPPVIVLTARNDQDAFTRAVSRGALAYVAKPFRFGDLLSTCRRVLREEAKAPRGREPDRRHERRRFLMATVTIYSREQHPMALGELVNVSPGGAQVELGVALDAGTHVLVGFHGPATSLNLEARIQWQEALEDERWAHGLSFIYHTPEQERPVRELLGVRLKD